MNDIVKYDTEGGSVELSPALIKKYLVSGGGNVSDQEIMMFLNLCKYQKLNPFLREAYLIKFGERNPATIVTGKEVFTKRAAKKQEFDGFDAGIVLMKKDGELIYRKGTLLAQSEELIGGWAEVYRKDWKCPVRAEVSLAEYKRYKADGQPMSNWKSMPATMIRKVALVQALREAFPEDLGGMYSQEEMPVDDSSLDVKEVKIEPSKNDKNDLSAPVNVSTTNNIPESQTSQNNHKESEIELTCVKCDAIVPEEVWTYKNQHLCKSCLTEKAKKQKEDKTNV